MRAHNLNSKVFLFGCLVLMGVATALLPGQSPGEGKQAHALPATTGEPLTIAPVDLPDIDCTVQDWSKASHKPVLTLLCPPEAVFAPLRVYLKLSWRRAEDVPEDVSRIMAQPGEQTRIRTSKDLLQVRLDVGRGTGHDPKPRWVGFNGVVDVALIKSNSRPR